MSNLEPHDLAWMARDYLSLTHYPTALVRLACTRRNGRGQYRNDHLIERHGRDLRLSTAR